MSKKEKSIAVNYFGGELNAGFFIERFSFSDLPPLGEWEQPERHDRHSFFLLEKGSVTMEIDFHKYKINSPSVIYLHPNQVHRIIGFENVTVTCLGINNESLNTAYLKLLEELAPAKPLKLKEEAFSIISETAFLSIKFTKRNTSELNQALLRDSCNVLVALMISLYQEKSKPVETHSRFDVVTKTFMRLLERDYSIDKRPAAYADKMSISASYLNECVRATTGHPLTHHIQQRVILEAKRLLYHSNKSVKEIAAELGYEDYPYFTRLFAKVTGMTALAFRTKNRI